MEKQYSAQFFSLLLDSIQDLCRTNLKFHRFVEVTGYISVELDNMKKERYVVNEIIQSSGHLVSESFCTKSFTTQIGHQPIQTSSQEHVPVSKVKHSVKTRDHFVDMFVPNKGPGRTEQYPAHHKPHMRSPSVSYLRQSGDRVASRNNQVYASRSDFSDNISDQRLLQWAKDTSDDFEISDNVIELDNDEDADHNYTLDSSSSNENRSVQTYSSNTQYQSHVSAITSKECQSVQETQLPFCTRKPAPAFRQQLPHSSPPKRSATEEVESDSKTISKVLKTSDKADIKPKVESMASAPSFLDDGEVIDLDMFEDEFDDVSTMEVQSSQDVPSETTLADSSLRMKTSSQNPSIRNVVKYAVNQFKKYHFLQTQEDIDLFTVPPEKLDNLLCDFFKGVRKSDGSEMNIQTLKNFQSHIDRYLREGGYPYSLVKDPVFQESRNWIKAKLTEGGKGRRNTTKHTPLSESEIEVLFQSQQLGMHSPDSLINTMWFLNTKFFGIRSLTEHFNLRWGDVVLEQDIHGQEYLVCPLKTIQHFAPKVFPNVENPSRCFVTCYKEYAALRPDGGLDDESFFYLCPQRTSQICYQDNTWFILEQLSWNRLSFLWRKMVAAAGLPPDRKVRSNWNV